MNGIQIFQNPTFGKVRALNIDGEPWFVGKDVAAALGYKNTKDALIRHVDDEDKRGSRFPTPSGEQNMTIVNESGLYSLILSSKLESAKAFKRWVTAEVLPGIRKHGAYMTPATLEAALLNPDTLIRLATELKSEREQKEALQAKIALDAPKVLYAETVAGAKDGMLIREFCKILRDNGKDIGEKRMFADLRALGFLIKAEGLDRNKPTQRAMDMGLFSIKETAIAKPNGETTTRTTPLLTDKGRQYFTKLYLAPDTEGGADNGEV